MKLEAIWIPSPQSCGRPRLWMLAILALPLSIASLMVMHVWVISVFVGTTAEDKFPSNVSPLLNDSQPRIVSGKLAKSNILATGRRPNASIMVGVMMMDDDVSVLTRKVIRIMLNSDEIDLRFIICRPGRRARSEPDVVPVDMPENVNFGKTQRWFWFALRNMGENIKAVMKMDTDSVFCLEHLLKIVHSSPQYAFYGRHHDPKGCGRYFVKDCWYYMQGGLYGVSAALLRELAAARVFQLPQTHKFHEDIKTGHWLNQTAVRQLIKAVDVRFIHSKALVNYELHTYENYIKSFLDASRKLNCAKQVNLLQEEQDQLRSGAKFMMGVSR